jgi:LmbE family N-acetylglucosaminyl deacetylase
MNANATSPDPLSAAIAAATAAFAVVAHPDDESFGLGGILSALSGAGVTVRVLCLTHGEASTLGAVTGLAEVRAAELRRAATVLGVGDVELLDFPDGGLADIPSGVLEVVVEERMDATDLVVVFEPGGVTGHPDHRAATAAAARVAARRGLSVLEWGVPPDVAATLNDEFASSFVAAEGVDVEVDRAAQLQAIRCHESQAHDNPILARRLALQGRRERLRLLPAAHSNIAAALGRRDGTFAPTPGGITKRSVET